MKRRQPPHARQPLTTLLLLSLLFILQACSSGGGSAPSYTVGGTISGLTGSLTLQNNGSETLTLTANGDYSFTTRLNEGTSYNITIQGQPENDTCTVSNGSGVVAKQNITISISCAPTTYTLGGSVSGLTGSLTLKNNNSDTLTLTQDGSYTFTTPQINASSYNITVDSQPDGQRCTLSTSSGSVAKADITTLDIQCLPTYTIGVTINGLQSATVTLQNNSEPYAISASGSHTFPTALTTGSNYNITIQSQPSGYQCTFSNNNTSGTVASQNINNITLNCNAAPNGYYTGGAAVKADNNSTALDLNDLQAMINGNRMMFMSDANHLLYDATITNISGINYSATVNIYKLGKVYTTATLTGTIQNHTIEGTLTGTKAGNGTFTLTGQTNSQQADLARLVTNYDPANYTGDVWQASVFGLGRPWGFAIDISTVVSGTNIIRFSSGDLGLIEGCSYYGSELVVISGSPLYQANIVLEGCRDGNGIDTEIISGNYTGLAVQYSVGSSNDTVLVAYTGAEAGFFAIYKAAPR